MKDLLKSIFLIALVIIIALSAIKLRMWQCEELFPNSSTLACVMWK